MYSLAPMPSKPGISSVGSSFEATCKPKPECAKPTTAPCDLAHLKIGQVPGGPVFDALRAGIILVLQIQQHDVTRMAGGEAGNFQVVVHDPVGRGELVVGGGEVLLLMVVIGAPREDARDVQALSQNLADHVLGLDALGGVHVMRAAGGVNVMVAGVPAVLRGIDPAIETEGELARARGVGGEFRGALVILGASGILRGVVAGRELDGLAIGAIDLRLEEEIGREALGGKRVDTVEAIPDEERRRRRPPLLVFDA